MKPTAFYGALSAMKLIYDGNISEDPDLSDDDTPREERILAPDSDVDDDIPECHNSLYEDTVIPESEPEDDNEVTEYCNTDYGSQNLAAMQDNSKKGRNKPIIDWKIGNLVRKDDEIQFTGNTALPQEIVGLETPVQYFKYFFTNEMIQYIVEQTNVYSVQCRPNKSVNVSTDEIEQFIGTCLYMSIIQLPATRHYWCGYLGHPAINEVISCNRWEEIKRYIHFCDNSKFVSAGEPNHDKLFKIRPLLNRLRERLLLVPKEEFLAVDEQIIPTKARSSIKQYNPKKPHKWGFKAFVLSGVSGFSYDFEIFAGAQSNVVIPGAPDLGVSGNVVVRLTETVPRHVNHKIFFDNWFTSVPLEVFLQKVGILSLGTVRANRVRGCNIPKETTMKKKCWGTMEEKVARVDGVQLSVVSWFDNKIVNTLSSYAGCTPEGETKRMFREKKEHRMISCPRSVMIYNNYMGGVDLLDSMLGYYRIQIRSKKWYLRIFFHLIDLACVNSWLLWRRNNSYYMPLVDFKVAVADALCKAGKVVSKKRGRPSTEVQKQLDVKRSKGPAADIPQPDVRTDGINHMPIWLENRGRCKYPECGGKSYVACQKCKVTLCINKDRNCFINFHEK